VESKDKKTIAQRAGGHFPVDLLKIKQFF